MTINNGTSNDTGNIIEHDYLEIIDSQLFHYFEKDGQVGSKNDGAYQVKQASVI